jgi:hypothetical protein
MTNCDFCGGYGLKRIRYYGGEPDEFAICLCAAGMAWRRDTNMGRKVAPLWHVWAAKEKVDPERVAPMEELLDDAEMRAASPGWRGAVQGPSMDDALMSAGRSNRVRL